MLLMEAIQLKHYIKDRLLFEADQLQIRTKDRIGLVGTNGSGKTTLLNILAEKIDPEEGKVIAHAQCELLPQFKNADTTKSGGEVTQEYINKAILKAPEILFADEPTTNLDTEHIEWLEKKLLQWKGALVVVSHDRAFLDNICTIIWEVRDKKVKVYKGNFRNYEEQKNLEMRQKQLAYEKYETKKKQLEEALKLKEQKAEKATKTPKKVSSIEAKKTKPYFAKKQKKLQKTASALETRLEKLEKVERPKEDSSLKMDIPNEDVFRDRVIIRVEDVIGRVSDRLLWEKANFQIRGGDKLAIIGSNGTGKTTLVKKMIHQEEGIFISPSVKIGYFSQNLNIVDRNKTILENVSSTSQRDESLIRTVLARLHFYRDDVHKLVSVLSGGERVKVALAKLFLSNINTLILDEPTNFLDIEAASALESLLDEYSGSVIFVSHDRRFIENLATRILAIEHKKITLFDGSYKQYKEHTQPKIQRNNEDQKLLIETKITEVLSRLSMEPSAELEKEFQLLLQEKRRLQ